MHRKIDSALQRALTLSLGSLMLLTACSDTRHRPTDPQATTATASLYNRLFQLRDKGIMLGHQDDIAYGHQRYEPGFSDVHDMTGDYPAVTGWEIGHVEKGDPYYEEYRDFCRRQFFRYVSRYLDAVHEKYPQFQIASNWIYSARVPQPAVLPVASSTAQAIAVASSPFIFNNDIIAVPAIIYALMMNVILLAYVAIVKRR